AAAYGWAKGYPDGTFRPEQSIVRAETVAMVNRFLGRHADTAYVDANTQKLHTFPDLPATHWAYYDVLEAANGHKHLREDGKEHWS
ncbi:MAG: S-layer homology domain-containing protein, partial [Oscillospiraceae bacterium]